MTINTAILRMLVLVSKVYVLSFDTSLYSASSPPNLTRSFHNLLPHV